MFSGGSLVLGCQGRHPVMKKSSMEVTPGDSTEVATGRTDLWYLRSVKSRSARPPGCQCR